VHPSSSIEPERTQRPTWERVRWGIRRVRSWIIHPRKKWKDASDRYRRQKAYRKLESFGLIDAFEGYPKDAIQPKYHELYGLYRLVMQRRPAVLLELGGGYSTFALAQACHDLERTGESVRLYSVDGSDYWQKVVKDRMPRRLRPFVRFYRANPKLTEINGVVVSIFDSLPVEQANLVYVDGGLVPGNDIGADALKLERGAPLDYAILVDGRTATVAFLREKLKRTYHVEPGLAGSQTLFLPHQPESRPFRLASLFFNPFQSGYCSFAILSASLLTVISSRFTASILLQYPIICHSGQGGRETRIL